MAVNNTKEWSLWRHKWWPKKYRFQELSSISIYWNLFRCLRVLRAEILVFLAISELSDIDIFWRIAINSKSRLPGQDSKRVKATGITNTSKRNDRIVIGQFLQICTCVSTSSIFVLCFGQIPRTSCTRVCNLARIPSVSPPLSHSRRSRVNALTVHSPHNSRRDITMHYAVRRII